MAQYRNQLPQLSNTFFINNGGLGTTLIFHEGVELPCFATFTVLKDEAGCLWMRNHLRKFVNIARKYNVGIVLESATWRASIDWIRKLGYSDQDVLNVNRKAIQLLDDIRNEHGNENIPIVISGSVGPRGDGYNPTVVMSAEEAQVYHTAQIGIISQTNADMVTALTMTYPEEAIGIARAGKAIGMPVVISFTVESDGKLPTGQTLKEAIELVDEATQCAPAYYMVDCAHPISFEHVLSPEEAWVRRIRGIKGNASKKSHAELDECKELDCGDPVEFGEYNRGLLYKLRNLNVLGGCCGTDYRHIEEICKACISTFARLKHIYNDPVRPIVPLQAIKYRTQLSI